MSQITPQQEADDFNARFEVGAWIGYCEVIGDPLTPYRTRTEASVLSGHTSVVWLVGKVGCVCTSHCSALPENEARDDKTMDLFGGAA